MTRCRGRCSVHCISSSIHALITKPHDAVAREMIREVVHIIFVVMTGNDVSRTGRILENGGSVELRDRPAIVKFSSCSDIPVWSGSLFSALGGTTRKAVTTTESKPDY